MTTKRGDAITRLESPPKTRPKLSATRSRCLWIRLPDSETRVRVRKLPIEYNIFIEFHRAKTIRRPFCTIGLFLFPFSASLLIQIRLRGESTSIQNLQAFTAGHASNPADHVRRTASRPFGAIFIVVCSGISAIEGESFHRRALMCNGSSFTLIGDSLK
jgi:hypothetical protein